MSYGTSVNALRAAAALAFLASVCALSARAQSSSTRTIERLLRERQRTVYLREVEEKMRRPAERPAEEEMRLALSQITEDYEHIQTVNNDLARAVSDPNALDLKLAAESTSEIRKRAERLLNNLALPELSADVERVRMPEEGEGQLRPSLGMLRRLVERFVRSPLFREVNVIDAQTAERARRDLEGIIELSGRLKRDCERYGKAPQ